MEIKQLQNMPEGEHIGGGFQLTIKTCKKKWQVKGYWRQWATLVDENNDEMIAEIYLGMNIPLRGGLAIKVIVAQIIMRDYNNKPKKMLYVDQWEYALSPVSEPPLSPSEEFQWGDTKVVRGKVKCLLLAAILQSGEIGLHEFGEADFSTIDKLVDYVMK